MVLFLINTYERPQKLVNLLWQIYTTCPYEARVIVVDDNSTSSYTRAKQCLSSHGDTFVSLPQHHGKYLYWKAVDTLFKLAEQQHFQWVFKLDDDIVLAPNAIQKALLLHNEMNARISKTVVNLLVDHRADQRVWTNTRPRTQRFGGEVIRKVGWVDAGNWMTSRKVMTYLNWSCPKPPNKWWEGPGDSSGVGKYLSREFSRLNCSIFMPKESLVYHGSHPSVMHPYKANRQIKMKKKPWT